MKGDEIPDANHVSRYCRYKTLTEEGLPGPQSFSPRQIDSYLSVNWIEYLRCDTREESVDQIRRVYRDKFKVKSSERISIVNVGEMKRKVYNGTIDHRNLRVRHEPENYVSKSSGKLSVDESHSGVYNFKFDEDFISILISQAVKREDVYPI